MTSQAPASADFELEAGSRPERRSASRAKARPAGHPGGARTSAFGPKIAVRVTPRSPSNTAGSPSVSGPARLGSTRTAFPRLVRGLLEAGVDWRGLHVFGRPNASMPRPLRSSQGRVVHAWQIATSRRALPELNLGRGFDMPCLPGERPSTSTTGDALTHHLHSADLLATTRFHSSLAAGWSGVRRLRPACSTGQRVAATRSSRPTAEATT